MNAVAPSTASRSASSGARTPTDGVRSTCGACGAGTVSRSRASRKRKRAPCHSCRPVRAASRPSSSSGSTSSPGAARALETAPARSSDRGTSRDGVSLRPPPRRGHGRSARGATASGHPGWRRDRDGGHHPVPGSRGSGARQAVRAVGPGGGCPAVRRLTFGAVLGVTTVRTPTEFEERLALYLYERSEEGRAVRVGEKETSEQAEIVRRYADLFSREQLDALREAEDVAHDEQRELLYRLRKTCEGGLVSAALVEKEDELENRLLAERVTFRGEEMPLRNAQAKLAVLPAYADREQLGELQADASARFNPDRLELIAAGEELSAELSRIADPVERNEEEKGISLRELSAALKVASDDATLSFTALRERWFEKLLGPERGDVPSSFHTAYLRRLSPLESTYTKERATEVSLATLTELGFDLAAKSNIKLDLDDRPQKSPRACVIASDPPTIVHLITRAQGGLHDYQ